MDFRVLPGGRRGYPALAHDLFPGVGRTDLLIFSNARSLILTDPAREFGIYDNGIVHDNSGIRRVGGFDTKFDQDIRTPWCDTGTAPAYFVLALPGRRLWVNPRFIANDHEPAIVAGESELGISVDIEGIRTYTVAHGACSMVRE